MPDVQITLQPSDDAPILNRNLYGHFAEHLGRGIYEGIWVGLDSEIPNTRGMRNDVLAALKQVGIPVLRWPGGCFADEYHWMNGIGPRESRPSMYNSHWGGVVEDNHFGTHEFLDLCELLGAEPYVCGNVGSGTVREMSEWVEYITSPAQSPRADLRRKNGRAEPWKLPFFGVGNESWGCGGNMRPEYYADLYRQYNTFVRTYGPNKIERIACGANTADFTWTEVLMRNAGTHMDGLAVHYYTLLDQTWPPSGSAIDFQEREWFSIMKSALRMDELITEHSRVMDRHDPEKKVGLIVDEWGCWHASEPGSKPGFLYQQNALRDALVAAVHFNIFHTHADRVRMANIAQMVNVLQALVLTDGPKMLRTPTYWAFDLYRVHQGATAIPIAISADQYTLGQDAIPAASASASRQGDRIAISLACLDPNKGRTISLKGLDLQSIESARILTADSMQAHNTFEAPDAVCARNFEVKLEGGKLEFELPAKSVVTVIANLD